MMKTKTLAITILLCSLFTSKSFGDINYSPFSYDRLKNRTEKFLLVRIIIGSEVVNPLTFVNIMEDKRLNPEDTLRVLFLNAHDIPEHQIEAIAELYDDDYSLIYNLQTESDKIQAAFTPENVEHDEFFFSFVRTFNDQIENPAYVSDIIKASVFYDFRHSCALDLDVRLLKPLEEIDQANKPLIDSPYFHSNEHYLDYPVDPYTFRDVSANGQLYLDAYYRGQYLKEEQMLEKSDDRLNHINKRPGFNWHSINVAKENDNTFNILLPAVKAPLLLRNEMDISNAQKLECTRVGIHYLDERNPKKQMESILNEQIKRAKELIKAPMDDQLYNVNSLKIIETFIRLPQ
ncbi:hypothetical protein [Endozoicomonas sp. 4G]|uniref:hypothetical protein n=1 Tax=Endozoicomonas sp. 4G TaxID=2872754 RepID=UPI002078F887|nr:hypothetical protein [Endozoicomonas sp. 4G]